MSEPRVGAGANWSGIHQYAAARLHQPQTVAEVQRLVAAAGRVRAVGSRHSFNALADSEGGDLVSLLGLPLDLQVDRERMRVTFGAGATYTDVAPLLERQGLALHNLASLPKITVAGAIANGTHGSGTGNGSLATALRAVELVRGDGTLDTVTDDDPDWNGYPVSLGYVGVATRLTLAVVPSFVARQHIYRDLPWDQVLAHFDELMGGAYSTSIFTRWRARAVEQVWRKTVDDSTAPFPEHWLGGILAPETSSLPALEGYRLTPRDGSPGPWWLRLIHFPPDGVPDLGNEMQSEYMVPLTRAVEAISALRALGDRLASVLVTSELRTCAADELWLSPMQGRPTLCIHFTWRKDPAAVVRLLPEIESALAPFEPRPHWGKVFAMEPETLRSRYPLLALFGDLVRRRDPDGVFANDYYRTYLTG